MRCVQIRTNFCFPFKYCIVKYIQILLLPVKFTFLHVSPFWNLGFDSWSEYIKVVQRNLVWQRLGFLILIYLFLLIVISHQLCSSMRFINNFFFLRQKWCHTFHFGIFSKTMHRRVMFLRRTSIYFVQWYLNTLYSQVLIFNSIS